MCTRAPRGDDNYLYNVLFMQDLSSPPLYVPLLSLLVCNIILGIFINASHCCRYLFSNTTSWFTCSVTHFGLPFAHEARELLLDMQQINFYDPVESWLDAGASGWWGHLVTCVINFWAATATAYCARVPRLVASLVKWYLCIESVVAAHPGCLYPLCHVISDITNLVLCPYMGERVIQKQYDRYNILYTFIIMFVGTPTSWYE